MKGVYTLQQLVKYGSAPLRDKDNGADKTKGKPKVDLCRRPPTLSDIINYFEKYVQK